VSYEENVDALELQVEKICFGASTTVCQANVTENSLFFREDLFFVLFFCSHRSTAARVIRRLA
jgi:hypothetical protein